PNYRSRLVLFVQGEGRERAAVRRVLEPHVVDLEARAPILVGQGPLPVLSGDLVEGEKARVAAQAGAGRVVLERLRVGALEVARAPALRRRDDVLISLHRAPEQHRIE